MFKLAEYIWLDGTSPTAQLRSKTRVVPLGDKQNITLKDFPEWSYDGSSTCQATGDHSDVLLKPVCFVTDPFRSRSNTEHDSYLVLCETFNSNNKPLKSNTRAILRKILESGGDKHEPWAGFEQEYTLFYDGRPLGWPESGAPEAQGPYYCGVGADKVYGREIADEHLKLCMNIGLFIYGVNAEVMLGQWEYQVGYRGANELDLNLLTLCDHQQLARWILIRVAERYDVAVSFENKPIKGDWNGSGCHINFSTKDIRDPEKGRKAIDQAIKNLEKYHKRDIKHYGDKLGERLTGKHETSSMKSFSSGVSNRGASVRIPLHVDRQGYGYIEDRRPGANCDPYISSAVLVNSVCDILEKDITPSLTVVNGD
tara:strand:- start:12688 stop:13794 length:1107 start_codon:yes stop_codon:yes gene_type:complete